jgi:hypothetical protein
LGKLCKAKSKQDKGLANFLIFSDRLSTNTEKLAMEVAIAILRDEKPQRKNQLPNEQELHLHKGTKPIAHDTK